MHDSTGNANSQACQKFKQHMKLKNQLAAHGLVSQQVGDVDIACRREGNGFIVEITALMHPDKVVRYVT